MSEPKTFLVYVPYATYGVFKMEADSIEDARRIARTATPDELAKTLEYYKGGSDGEDDFAGIEPEMIEEA